MKALPQEVIDHISSYLNKEDLQQLLTVSRQFRHAAERTSGVFAEFNLKESNADQFLQTYTGHRFRYLEHVRFMTTFPMFIERADSGCRESANDLAQRDKLFTQQINFLFRTLKVLQDGMDHKQGCRKIRLTIFPPRRAVDSYCLHRVCISWRVHLLQPENLPELALVNHLSVIKGDSVYRDNFDPFQIRYYSDPENVDSHAPAKLGLRVLIDLASKMPNLESMDCQLWTCFWGSAFNEEVVRHYTQDWTGPYRDSRNGFSEVLKTVSLPSSLKSINLDFHSDLMLEQRGRDQRMALPNLVYPQAYDPFSASLRLLSYQLVRMVLRVTADSTLFWPNNEESPSWPNLQSLNVMFHPACPSGSWFFQGPKGEGHDASGYEITEADYEPLETSPKDELYDRDFCVRYNGIMAAFRVIPIESTLRPFLYAFAKAAINMPMLQEAALWSPLEFSPYNAFEYYDAEEAELEKKYGNQTRSGKLGWGIVYAKPGQRIQPDGIGQLECATRQLWWLFRDWRPDEELHWLLQQIGTREYGGEVTEHWAEDYGPLWPQRHIFHDLASDSCSKS